MRKQLLTTAFLAIIATVSPQTATAQSLCVGGDISMLPKYEQAGVVYKDKDGRVVNDPLVFFRQEGLNAMRVRLFVDPSHDSDKGVCQDLDYVTALGKRIKEAGMKFMLDFHYSDTWADPSKQWTPDAWKDLDDSALSVKVYEYTKECLRHLNDAGAAPDMIQTGNEISYGMLWGTADKANDGQVNRCFTNGSDAAWNRFLNLLRQAGKACREECPEAKIVLHNERVPRTNVLADFFDRMEQGGIDYDIIGLSYYPAYHGKLSVLESAINTLENRGYGKDIMVVETGYSYAWAIPDTEFDYTATYPYTEEGQRRFTADLVAMLRQHATVKGLFWWWIEDNGYKKVTDRWWDAALYNHDTGKPYNAFYELKAFAPGATAIDDATTGVLSGSSAEITATVSYRPRDTRWYNLQGQCFDSRPQRHGLYIVGGRKVVIK